MENFKRNISRMGLLGTALTGIIGSGWLFGPFYAARMAGPGAIISWVIGGLLMMLVALTFVELACVLPKSGSLVRFAHMTHGPLVGLVFGWVAWLSSVTVPPIETLALIQYAANYSPSLMIDQGQDRVLSLQGLLLSAVLLLFMCWLNRFGGKKAVHFNTFIVILKVIVPILTIVLLLSHGLNLPTLIAVHGMLPYGWQGVLSALPTAGVVFSFIGYSAALQMAGEARDPQKTLPFAILGALIIGIVFYVTVQTVFIGALPLSTVQGGWHTLHYAHDAGPVAGLMLGLGFTWFLGILYFDALVSPFGTAYAYTMTSGRVNYALADNGHMPAFFKQLNRHHVPWRALKFNYICGLVLLMPFPAWQRLVGFLVTAFVLVYSVGPLSVIALRYQQPDLERPFRLPCVHVLSFCAFYSCNLMFYWTGWQTISKLIGLIALGGIVLWVIQSLGHREIEKSDIVRAWWLGLHLLSMGVVSYLGTFGGGLGIIPFGWDLLAIGAVSILTFVTAIRAVYLQAPNQTTSQIVI